MRQLAALALFALLAACASPTVSTGPEVGEPRLLAEAVVTADDVRLPLRHWLPEGKPKAVILYIHGFNDYSNALARPAPYLTAHGIAAYAYDQRGFGAAPNPGRWSGEGPMAADVATVARLLAARHPGAPLYLLGESMGGAIVMRTMVGPHPPDVAGVILVAPAVWTRERMNVFERVGLWVGNHALPWLPVNGNGLDIWPSDNIEMLRELGRDPLVIKDTRIDTLDGLVDLMDDAYDSAPKLHGPILMLYGEHDEIVPPKPTYDVMATFEDRPDIVRAIYPKGYHMLMRDLQADTVMADIVSWIEHPKAPLPSGADQRAITVLADHHPRPIGLDGKSPG
jgi:alpha-beta hydrolase superfamily lysophospholipase